MNNECCVVIVAKDIEQKLVGYIASQFLDYSVYVVTPGDVALNFPNVEVYPDDYFYDFTAFSKKIENTSLRVGWYYQQFLKLHICLKLNYKYTYILDGDSVVNNSLLSDCELVTSTGKLAEQQYLKFNNKLLGLSDIDVKSYVTNEMIFSKSELENLIQEIESFNSSYWVDAIIDILIENSDMQFSEYQLYGSYVTQKKYYPIKNIKVFRRMDCVNDSIDSALKKYDLVAFESHHKTGLFRKLRAKILYSLGMNLG